MAWEENINSIKIKIKEVFIPYLAISIATLLIYNFIRYYFDIKLGIIPLKEDVLNFWIPFFIPWIPVLIWLRRRIRILNVNGKRDNGHFAFQFAMVAAIGIPLIISQNYIEKSSYDLIELKSISEAENYPREKYFTIDDFEVEKGECLNYLTSRTSGKSNNELNFYFYLACPFKKSSSVWYGVRYRRGRSNSGDEATKNLEYRKFFSESKDRVERYGFRKPRYFENLAYSDERDGYLEAIKKEDGNIVESDQIILIPRNDIFSERAGNSFQWIFGSFLIGSMIILGMIIFQRIDQKELNDFKKNKPLKEDELKDMLTFLNPKGEYGATGTLFIINVLVFIIMIFYGLNIFSPSAKELFEIGGNRRYEVMNGDSWRLITSVFIHGGLGHLLVNMLSLGFTGALLEKIIGSFKFALFFLLCGVLASITSIYWHEYTVSVGASGAIFGLNGIMLAFNIFKIYSKDSRSLVWMFLGGFVGLGLLIGLTGGIDNAAHLGGLISGFLIGCILVLVDKEKMKEKASKQLL